MLIVIAVFIGALTTVQHDALGTKKSGHRSFALGAPRHRRGSSVLQDPGIHVLSRQFLNLLLGLDVSWVHLNSDQF